MNPALSKLLCNNLISQEIVALAISLLNIVASVPKSSGINVLLTLPLIIAGNALQNIQRVVPGRESASAIVHSKVINEILSINCSDEDPGSIGPKLRQLRIQKMARNTSLLGTTGFISHSEEMKNPSVDIPTVMIGTILINGTLGLGFLVALLFNMGDLASALETTTGFPIIRIFYNITGNVHSATALCTTVVIIAGLASSASRMLWVLARDNGNNINPSSRIPSAKLYSLSSPIRPRLVTS